MGLICYRYQEAEKENRRYGDNSRGSLEQLYESCLATLRYAQQYNAYTDEVIALRAAVFAWQAVVEIAVSRR